MTTISLRLEDEDALLIKQYASRKQMTVSELIRKTARECIAEEFDLCAYQKAVAAMVGEMLEVTP